MANNLKNLVMAILKLGYKDYGTLVEALENGNRRSAKSLWGKLSVVMFGKNRPNKRTTLHLKWTHNKAQLRTLLKEQMTNTDKFDKIDKLDSLDKFDKIDKLDSLDKFDKLDSLDFR